MWVRLQLDVGWWDVAYGFARCLGTRDGVAWRCEIEEDWSPQGNALACLSVRSGFCLLLDTLRLPPGSEVVFTALNIPDMVTIAREHHLVPVPVDLDLTTLAPDLDLLREAITPKTRALVVAHLYGNRVPMTPLVELARRHDLLLIEDCAEVFDGEYRGHPGADVSLFSFGPLKTATAFAGGILTARDLGLLARLRAEHERWPRQSSWDYFKRLCKYSTLKFFGQKWLFGAVRAAAGLVVDMDKLINHSAKSFRETEIMRRFRQRPCAALLAVLARRLRRFDRRRVAERAALGRLLAERLGGAYLCPGTAVEPHVHWLFPVLADEPRRVIAALADAGFDATQATTMTAIDPPPDRPELAPARGREAIEKMVFIPCYAGLPRSEAERLAAVLLRLAREAKAEVSATRVRVDGAEADLPSPHGAGERRLAEATAG